MTEFQNLGLSISVADPLIKSNRSAITRNLTTKINSYSHESRLVGGWYSASIRMTDKEEEINDWIQNGLGRDVEVFNPSGVLVWNGFVNTINIKMGEVSFSVGPLVDIGNRIAVTYSVIDTSSYPPTLGSRATTAVANNSNSQTLYGIWHKIKSINGATSTEAEQLRDVFVNDPTRAYPATSGDFSLSGGSSFNMSLDLLGYWHWFAAWYYENNATGTINLSQKIEDVLADDPNSIFSTDYSKVTENTTQVRDGYDAASLTALTIMKELNSRGDSSNNPYSIGIYDNRRLVYEAIPTEIEYYKRRGQPVTDELQGLVRPWDVKPAKWLSRPDFLVGRHPPITSETLGTDPRAGLIEVVKYSTAYGLSVNGAKLSQLDQILAKRGIGGLA